MSLTRSAYHYEVSGLQHPQILPLPPLLFPARILDCSLLGGILTDQRPYVSHKSH